MFHGWKLKHLQLLRNCFCLQACESTSWCSPFKIYMVVSMEVVQYAWGQRQRVIEGEGVMDEESLALEVSTWWGGWGPARSHHSKHKACLVWDKRRAPGGPYGTIFTIRDSLFSLGLTARACQESSMLAGLEVVLGSTIRGERGSLTGWARGFGSSSTYYLTTIVYLTYL